MHFVQNESGLCLQEVSHHSLKRKWELCFSEHGRGGLSHSFPHKGMGEALLGSFRKVYFHSVEQKKVDRILRSQGFIVQGINSLFPGGLVLAGLSPAHWGGVLGSFQQYGGLPSFLSEDTMGPRNSGGLAPATQSSFHRQSEQDSSCLTPSQRSKSGEASPWNGMGSGENSSKVGPEPSHPDKWQARPHSVFQRKAGL